MAAAPAREIIDLTESPPPPEPIVIDSGSDEADANNSKTTRQERTPRRRKKKRKKASLEAGEVEESDLGEGSNPKRQVTLGSGDPAAGRRSRSPGPRQKSPDAPDDFADLFFVDIKPTSIASAAKPTNTTRAPSEPTSNKEVDKPQLLLPEHVSVFGLGESGEGPVEIIRPLTPNTDEEDFIEYLDYDDRNKGLVRYFDEVTEETKPTRFVCKNCGAEGDHKTSECRVQICLTCGARNEHSTRGCPISKTCFTCGMKGHIVQNCPNRSGRRGDAIDRFDDCDRCGASIHKTNECPTWWRMYEYVSDKERLLILQERKTKQDLGIGQGGEGYIGREYCCYNCGGEGHWGDDCNEVPHLWDFPREPSAFSTHNTMSGPFFDPDAEPSAYAASHRPPDHDLPVGWGLDAPVDVGKQARKKDKIKLEKRFHDQEANAEADTWFDNPRNARSRGMQTTTLSKQGSSRGPKKMSFGISIKDAARQFQPSPAETPPSLLARLGDSKSDSHRSRKDDDHAPRSRSFSNHKRGREDDYKSRDSSISGRYEGERRREASERERKRDRDRDRLDRDRDRDRRSGRDREGGYRRQEPGPRYTGGYSR